MTEWTSLAPTMLASFLASMVEFVEALTIVLAVGIVRGWRSALLGTGAALAVLVALVLLLGPALARIPLPVVQLVVGTLLLMWLLAPVLTPFVVAAILAYALTPVVDWLDDLGHGRVPRLMAVVLVEVLFLMMLMALMWTSWKP